MQFSIRLPKNHKWTLYCVWGLISVTGVYFAYSQDWMMLAPSDWTIYSLKMHGICASIMWLLIGSLIAVHIKLSLRIRRNLSTGFSMLTIMLLLASTGTALYYSPEEWNHLIKIVHIWIGLIAILLLPIHILVGHKQRPKKISHYPK